MRNDAFSVSNAGHVRHARRSPDGRTSTVTIRAADGERFSVSVEQMSEILVRAGRGDRTFVLDDLSVTVSGDGTVFATDAGKPEFVDVEVRN